MTIATALLTAVIGGYFPERATRFASVWFAVGAAIALLSCRVPFDLGLALGLGALLAAQRERDALALALAAVCALSSPVAGAFLALAALAWAIAGDQRTRAVMLAAVALAPILVLVLLFPEGGTQPFVGSAFYPALAAVLLIAALMPGAQRVLRTGVLLYAFALTAAFVASTAVGGNADRLGALVAGPVAALALLAPRRPGRRPLLLLALVPALTYWQANAPVVDFLNANSDPAVSASYYSPLLGELRTLGATSPVHPARIEVVATRDHWEARWAAAQVSIARGWERQLDRYRNGLFYDGARLTAQRYHAWLLAQAISYVALPDAPLDYSGKSEARVVRGTSAGSAPAAAAGRPPAYLREVWRSQHWRLFAVRDAAPMATAPAVLTRLDHSSFSLRVPTAGTYTVRVHFTPYWALARGAGCVSRAPGDWTRVRARAAGELRVIVGFSLARVFDHGPRCS
jgi:hypothetical protein